MKIHRLQSYIQHYQWGGNTFIPNLLNIENPNNEPHAEIWIGAHPKGSAKVQIEGNDLRLDHLIQQQPKVWLGEEIAQKFDNRLPYLLKILDVKDMLSIQVHPTKAQAEIGFKAEEKVGISRTAPNRNFRDNNHKPELMVALTDFWLLHGFRSVGEIEAILVKVPEFECLKKQFLQKDIFALYEYIMKLPELEVHQILAPLRKRLRMEKEVGQLSKQTPDYWAQRAFEMNTERLDRGIFSIYLFNLLNLKKGEGIFQDAGIPHAYLEGVNVELMANSDNVLRGGLTVKHIDVPMLLKHTIFDPVQPKIMHGVQVSAAELKFTVPVPDFELSRIETSSKVSYYNKVGNRPDALIVLEGSGRIKGGDSTSLIFQKGETFFMSDGVKYEIHSEEKAVIFKATVP